MIISCEFFFFIICICLCVNVLFCLFIVFWVYFSLQNNYLFLLLCICFFVIVIIIIMMTTINFCFAKELAYRFMNRFLFCFVVNYVFLQRINLGLIFHNHNLLSKHYLLTRLFNPKIKKHIS